MSERALLGERMSEVVVCLKRAVGVLDIDVDDAVGRCCPSMMM